MNSFILLLQYHSVVLSLGAFHHLNMGVLKVEILHILPKLPKIWKVPISCTINYDTALPGVLILSTLNIIHFSAPLYSKNNIASMAFDQIETSILTSTAAGDPR